VANADRFCLGSRIRSVAFIAAAVLCAASPAIHAAEPDLRVGAGLDVIHKRGAVMAAVTYQPVSFYAWGNDNFGVGLTYRFGGPKGFSFNAGGIAVYRTDAVIGTHLNFLVRLSYCGKELCASFAHVSHGKIFGFDKDSANSGLNFLYLEYRLR
jgi:ABC-type amino acid transport substrate-binding protein